MTSRTLCILIALAACNNDDGTTVTGAGVGTPVGTPAGTPAGTETSYPTTTTPPVGDASCEVDTTNGLRVHCTASLEEPGWATVVMRATSAPERSFLSEAAGTDVALHAWGLKANTEYTWTIGEASGKVTTGALPSVLQGISVQQSGTPSGFDGLLVPVNCGSNYFVVVDTDGDVVWYEQNGLYSNGMDAYEWSQEDRSLLVGGRNSNAVEEIHVSGELRGDWTGFSGQVHHDLERWNGYTYILEQHSASGYTVDGVHVYDGNSLIGSFALEDHYTPSGGGGGPGGGSEWSHANGIEMNDDGELILSMRSLSAVISIDGDPSSNTFLEINWAANGESGTGLTGADYSASSAFSQQHNASYVDGTLYLFDNHGDSLSRAGKYSLNSNGDIDIVETWTMNDICDPEGGAVPLADGGVVATCADSREIKQFTPGTPSAVYTLNASCGGGGGGPGGGEAMNRAIPVWIE